MTELTLTASRHIAAPIRTVFNAWLAPEMLAKFMLPGENTSVPHAQSDARIGGRFAITMKAGDRELPHGGEYKEINPHSRLAFTWESPFSAEGSTVTLNFSEPAKGGTDLELVHVKFPDEQSRDNHMNGWTNILAMLDETLSTIEAKAS